MYDLIITCLEKGKKKYESINKPEEEKKKKEPTWQKMPLRIL